MFGSFLNIALLPLPPTPGSGSYPTPFCDALPLDEVFSTLDLFGFPPLFCSASPLRQFVADYRRFPLAFFELSPCHVVLCDFVLKKEFFDVSFLTLFFFS